jgi:F-type H+-transporting ATPase subunit b
MFAFFYSALLLLASSSGGGEGGFSEFWDSYLNYPGFEIWKFVNLAIFVAAFLYFVRKPLSKAFKAKREVIRAELIKAEEAKKAALARLTEVEARLAGVETEIEAIKREAREEIEAEKQRLAAQAAAEAAKLKEQAAGEISRIGQIAKLELRRFAVNESLRVAEERLRTQMTPETDSRLIRAGIQAIGGLN